MKKLFVLLSLCTVVFSANAEQGQESIYAKYACVNKMNYELNVEFNNKKDELVVTYKDKSTVYPAALSADGARYSDGKNEYWFKGDKLVINGKIKCKEI